MKYFSFKAFQEGSHVELEKVFFHHHWRLYTYAMGILNDTNSAGDIVADSIIELWNKRKTIKSEEHLRPWLFTVVRNKAIDELRRRKSLQTIYVEAFPEMEDDQEAEIVRNDLLRLITGMMDELPPKMQEILRMRYIEGLTPKEIGKRMGIEQSTVYNHLRGGIEKIKDLLRNDFF